MAEVRVRQSEVDPSKWAVDWRASDLETWDTMPYRFSKQEDAERYAEQLEAEHSADSTET